MTALAMDGVCPPSKLQASLLSYSPTVFVNGVVHVGVERYLFIYLVNISLILVYLQLLFSWTGHFLTYVSVCLS